MFTAQIPDHEPPINEPLSPPRNLLSIPTLRCMQRSSDDFNFRGATERPQPRWPQVAVAVAGSGWLRRAQAMGVGPLLQSGERVCLQRSPPRRTSPVLKIWLRWKRLFFRVCEIATPIGLDDARTHVEEFFVGSSIHGDNLTCRLARKLRQVQERFEAARLEDMAANCYRGEETLDLVPVPWRKRAVRALQCASVADAGRGRGMKTTMSLQKSTAQARRLWSSKAVRHGLVG